MHSCTQIQIFDSFISRKCEAPLQETVSEMPPGQLGQHKIDLSNLSEGITDVVEFTGTNTLVEPDRTYWT